MIQNEQGEKATQLFNVNKTKLINYHYLAWYQRVLYYYKKLHNSSPQINTTALFYAGQSLIHLLLATEHAYKFLLLYKGKGFGKTSIEVEMDLY